MREKQIVHVVALRLSRADSSAEAVFVAPSWMAHDGQAIKSAADALGIEVEIDITGAPLSTSGEIVEWLQQFAPTPKPAIARPEYEQRLDELTRAQRNTDRKLDRIMDLLEGKRETAVREAVGLPTSGLKIGIPDVVPPAVIEPSDDEPAPRVDRLGRGQPTEQGEHTQGAATRHLTTQVTGVAGVLSGNMALQGHSASSEVWGVGADGEPQKTALPKVGDSLKPLHMRNG